MARFENHESSCLFQYLAFLYCFHASFRKHENNVEKRVSTPQQLSELSNSVANIKSIIKREPRVDHCVAQCENVEVLRGQVKLSKVNWVMSVSNVVASFKMPLEGEKNV